jgi:hypothetical protein
MSDKFWQWVAARLPKRLVYFASIRLIAYATTGKYGTTIVPELSAMDALQRWEAIGEQGYEIINRKIAELQRERRALWTQLGEAERGIEAISGDKKCT